MLYHVSTMSVPCQYHSVPSWWNIPRYIHITHENYSIEILIGGKPYPGNILFHQNYSTKIIPRGHGGGWKLYKDPNMENRAPARIKHRKICCWGDASLIWLYNSMVILSRAGWGDPCCCLGSAMSVQHRLHSSSDVSFATFTGPLKFSHPCLGVSEVKKSPENCFKSLVVLPCAAGDLLVCKVFQDLGGDLFSSMFRRFRS